MDTGRFLKWFGLLFVVLGALIGTGLLVGAFASKLWFLLAMALAFYGLFCGIGGFFAWCGISMMRSNQNDEALLSEDEIVLAHEVEDSVTSVFCPSCGAVVRVPSGESISCPSCGKQVKAPSK